MWSNASHTGIGTETKNVPKAHLPQSLRHSPATMVLGIREGWARVGWNLKITLHVCTQVASFVSDSSPMDSSPSGSSVHVMLQARSRLHLLLQRIFLTQDWTYVLRFVRRFFTTGPHGKPQAWLVVVVYSHGSDTSFTAVCASLSIYIYIYSLLITSTFVVWTWFGTRGLTVWTAHIAKDVPAWPVGS